MPKNGFLKIKKKLEHAGKPIASLILRPPMLNVV